VGLLRSRKERAAAGGRDESTEAAKLGAGPAEATVTMGSHIDTTGRKRRVEAVAGVATSPSVNSKKQKRRRRVAGR
jgi:hypothetical protein